MWQFGWMLSLIPDSILLWVINGILFIGLVGTVAGFFIKFIPFVNQYRLPVQLVSVLLLVAGVYFKGGYSTEMKWRERVAEVEAKIAIAEKKSAETNVSIQTKIVEKVKIIKDVEYVIQERIKEVEKIVDAKCEIVPEAVDIHNAAAKNRKPGEVK